MMIELRQPDALLKKLLPPQKLQPDTVYVPSQFSLTFVHNGHHYIFNTLTKQCVNAELPEQCRAGEGFDDLIRNRFLVPQGKDECAFYQSVSTMLRAYSHKNGVKSYTILPTLCCNARCFYCYEEGCQSLTMTQETVEQTIRYIIDSHVGDKVKLTWFGGEPLLRADIIDRICEGLREAGIDFKSTMISNGSLITPAIVEKMTGAWNLQYIQISTDGDEQEYVRRKRYITDDNQYRKVLSAIDMMSSRDITVAVRCNIDEGNIDSIPAFADDLASTIHNRDKVLLYLSPLFDVRSGDNAMQFWEKVIAARSQIAASGIHVYNIIGFSGSFRVNHCMADSGAVVICPDGVLSPCEHLQQAAAFGDIWRGVTDESARREFCRTDRIREKCRKCTFLPECTGFASCPIYDADCAKLRRMMIIDSLKRRIDKKETYFDGDIPLC